MLARIYQPAKTAMQSGQAQTKDWVFEFEPAMARNLDPLTGWTSSADMNGQVRLTFPSRQEAIAYAKRHQIPHQVCNTRTRRRVLKAYADNFKFGRKELWTH